MKKINLRGLQEVLSEKELKNVMGGSGVHENCDPEEPCTLTCGNFSVMEPYEGCIVMVSKYSDKCIEYAEGNVGISCSGWCTDFC